MAPPGRRQVRSAGPRTGPRRGCICNILGIALQASGLGSDARVRDVGAYWILKQTRLRFSSLEVFYV